MGCIARDVFGEEGAACGAGGNGAVVALVACPFREVVGEIEGGWRGRGVFVIDEGDGSYVFVCVGCGGWDDDVGAEEIAMGKDELESKSHVSGVVDIA